MLIFVYIHLSRLNFLFEMPSVDLGFIGKGHIYCVTWPWAKPVLSLDLNKILDNNAFYEIGFYRKRSHGLCNMIVG